MLACKVGASLVHEVPVRIHEYAGRGFVRTLRGEGPVYAYASIGLDFFFHLCTTPESLANTLGIHDFMTQRGMLFTDGWVCLLR